VTLLRTSSFVSILICLVVVLSISAAFTQSLSARNELIMNGGFEEGWNGWEKYTLGRGYASLDPVDPYEGQHSLAIQGTPTPQAGVWYGSGVNQTIESSSLPLDLEFAFWAKPWVSGKGIVEIKALLTLYTVFQTSDIRVLKIVYYVAWLGGTESWANIRQDEADYFVQGAIPMSWNYFQTNVKDDFESRWGDSTGYSLSKIVITLAITVGYPATNTEYANWDDISLTASTATTTQTATTITTSTTTQSPTTMVTTRTTATTTSSSETTGGVFLFGSSMSSIALVVVIIAVVSVAAIVLLRPRSRLSAAPQEPTKYCISCGAPMHLTAKYCPKCGFNQ